MKMSSDHGWTISDDEEEIETSLLPQRAKRDRYGRPMKKEFASPSHILTKNVEAKSSLPPCRYGSECYRKSSQHLKEFSHCDQKPVDESPIPKKKQKLDLGKECHDTRDPKTVWEHSSPFNFLLTTVNGINSRYNHSNTSTPMCSIGITDIFSPSFGELMETAQFNYCMDVNWFMQQIPEEKRRIPILLVHGGQGLDVNDLKFAMEIYSNIKSCRVDLPQFGTHHTKMMFLRYKDGIRIIIHTANLVEKDWDMKTQGMWLSPLFPPETAANQSKAQFSFKQDLLEYLKAYNKQPLAHWIDLIKSHDLSLAKVVLVGSVPGRHKGPDLHKWGHLKMAKALNHFANCTSTAGWSLIGQFSSIGSLGADKDKWLCSEWLKSLSSTKSDAKSGSLRITSSKGIPIKLIFPAVEDVRTSLEGYPAGASIPYSISVAQKQTWLNNFFHRWKAGHAGRSSASPHIKTYARVSKDFSEAAWFLLTSANLSKAAWGSFEKKQTQLMIRSFELGVLFLPSQFFPDSGKHTLSLREGESGRGKFTLPFETPLTKYSEEDEPWIWNIPHRKLPDRHGNMWSL